MKDGLRQGFARALSFLAWKRNVLAHFIGPYHNGYMAWGYFLVVLFIFTCNVCMPVIHCLSLVFCGGGLETTVNVNYPHF